MHLSKSSRKASSTGRAPRKGPRGQFGVCLHACPPFCSSLVNSLAVFSLPPDDTDAFAFSLCLPPSLSLLLPHWHRFSSSELQLSQRYWLQGAREALHSQGICPAHSAAVPGRQLNQLLFSTIQRGNTANEMYNPQFGLFGVLLQIYNLIFTLFVEASKITRISIMRGFTAQINVRRSMKDLQC